MQANCEFFPSVCRDRLNHPQPSLDEYHKSTTLVNWAQE